MGPLFPPDGPQAPEAFHHKGFSRRPTTAAPWHMHAHPCRRLPHRSSCVQELQCATHSHRSMYSLELCRASAGKRMSLAYPVRGSIGATGRRPPPAWRLNASNVTPHVWHEQRRSNCMRPALADWPQGHCRSTVQVHNTSALEGLAFATHGVDTTYHQ